MRQTKFSRRQVVTAGAALGAGEDDRASGSVGDLGGDDLLVLRLDQQRVVRHCRHGGGAVVGRVLGRVGEVLLHDTVDAAVEEAVVDAVAEAPRKKASDDGDRPAARAKPAAKGEATAAKADTRQPAARKTETAKAAAPASGRPSSRPGRSSRDPVTKTADAVDSAIAEAVSNSTAAPAAAKLAAAPSSLVPLRKPSRAKTPAADAEAEAVAAAAAAAPPPCE